VALIRSVLHHSEAIDPTLAEWIRHKIDDVLGLEPGTIVAILGVVILAFPVWLGFSAARQRRRAESEAAEVSAPR
jgi:hypothetical protein